MHTKMHSLCCNALEKSNIYVLSFLRDTFETKSLLSILQQTTFSPIYFTTSFPNFQVLRELWMSLAFSNRTLWTRFPFSTASILIQNRVKIFMELYFRSYTFTVSRNIIQCNWKCQIKVSLETGTDFIALPGKVMKIWILEFPPKLLSHQNWEASVISPKVFWKVARFFFSAVQYVI